MAFIPINWQRRLARVIVCDYYLRAGFRPILSRLPCKSWQWIANVLECIKEIPVSRMEGLEPFAAKTVYTVEYDSWLPRPNRHLGSPAREMSLRLNSQPTFCQLCLVKATARTPFSREIFTPRFFCTRLLSRCCFTSPIRW